ncbi:MAG TPA: hypothetical protein VFU31_22930 [Candidatus Binatia bacterium]|nr:hypothetical protein [Candidatus Binatia bacterium]
MYRLNWTQHGLLFCCALVLSPLVFLSCSMQPNIPTVSDDPIERLVRDEAARIVAVSEDKDRAAEYQIFLSDFPRTDILGMSVGNRRIYISHRLAKLASRRPSYLWLLRQTLAHEVAHETAGHARRNGVSGFNHLPGAHGITAEDVGLPRNVAFRHYSVDKELEADLKGLSYWSKLQWDCQIWVGILEQFLRQNYLGDKFHPTDRRLQQAQRVCLSQDRQQRLREASIAAAPR